MEQINWTEQLVEAWNTNNRINLFLLEKITDEGMNCTLSKRGGGTPAKQFAHMHNLRCDKLVNWHYPLSDIVEKLSMYDELNKERLKECLNTSGEQMALFIRQYTEEGNNFKTFKKGLVSSISYFISHESHHRGNLIQTLKLSGHRLNKDTLYAIWYWDKM
ncbi:DinB family protein [Pseudalkalibacillus salsuginis]|uniref:DinB family protein n=1 Tax=Pseudalkalibacillus salsuginis TaxID=2910972 RepID=UPI001F4763AD|nr:DinB family protein [Pseudalkalibacillus salsuginis]MCF6409675.1 DinB family protein [Pseudalkalibacillus salsuginis]